MTFPATFASQEDGVVCAERHAFVVNPDASYVTEPVPGKSVVTLQTCTLPDYEQRLIVQAELTDVS